MICPKCGNYMPSFEKVCSKCGNRQLSDEEIMDIAKQSEQGIRENRQFHKRVSYAINLLLPGFGLYVYNGRWELTLICFPIYLLGWFLVFKGLDIPGVTFISPKLVFIIPLVIMALSYLVLYQAVKKK